MSEAVKEQSSTRGDREAGGRDRRLDAMLFRALTIGTAMAAGVVAVGAAVFIAERGGEHHRFKSFSAEESTFGSLQGVWESLLAMDGRAVIQLGVLLLILTPVMRVALTCARFAAKRDWLYAAVCFVVLGVVAAGLFGGLG